jgi:hypothetical protein
MPKLSILVLVISRCTNQDLLTGAQNFEYSWQIDGEELQSLNNYEHAKAFLTVTLPNGMIFNTYSSVSKY